MSAVISKSAFQPITRAEMQAGFAAGFVGGLAEILWIAAYQATTGASPARVARGVIETVAPNLGAHALAAPLGVLVHMLLSLALGLALAVFARRVLAPALGGSRAFLSVVGLLIGVWAVNFFVVLPILNPDFVTLVPYSASLMSKALFGVAAAAALMRGAFWRAR
ncbi:MAG: hypothetical protein JNK46_01990 [Methylobacteriaceae bacterium]|nr:hypothetical protein [Methylobacteriaceae bacterium]